MVSFGPLTKIPAMASAGGTTLFRMAELESPHYPGLLEAGGRDTGPIGLVRTSLWFAGATCVGALRTSPDQPTASALSVTRSSTSIPAPTSQVSFSFRSIYKSG